MTSWVRPSEGAIMTSQPNRSQFSNKFKDPINDPIDLNVTSSDNLSWLLNFKLDDSILPNVDSLSENAKKSQSNASISNIDSLSKTDNSECLTKSSIQTEPKEVSSNSSNQTESNSNPATFKKPPFTYTELIEHALQEKGELTVSGIYQWISDHFPYYKSNDDRWKNSVRHNLSINPHFRKGSKAVHGAGHLWTIAHTDDTRSQSWLIKNKRLQQFIALTNQQINEEQSSREEKETMEIVPSTNAFPVVESIEMTAIPELNNKTQTNYGVNYTENGKDVSMGKKVEVQYIIPMTGSMDLIYPIDQSEIIEEYEVHPIDENDIRLTSASEIVLDDLQQASVIEDYFVTDDASPVNLNSLDYTSYQQLFYSDEFNLQYSELLT